MWREIAVRSFWLSTGSTTGRLLPFAVLVFLGRQQRFEDFASVGVGFAWTAVAASLTTVGLGNVTTQQLALLHPEVQRAFIRRTARLGILLSCGLTVIVAIAGPQLVSAAFGRVIDPGVVLPALVCGNLWSLVMLTVAICNGQHRPRTAAAVLGVGGALQGAGLLLGHVMGGTAPAVVWGAAIGNSVALGWAITRVRARVPVHTPSAHAAAIPYRFYRSVAWSTLAAATVMPASFVAGSFISHTNDGVRQLAAFQALEQLYQLAVYLPNIIGQALVPILVVHMGNSSADVGRTVVKASLGLAFVGISVAAALAWQPEWLHRLVANPALTEAAGTRAMLLSAGLATPLALLGSGLLAHGYFARGTLLNVGWSIVLLTLAWHWRLDGASGVQTARLCASCGLLIVASTVLWFGARAGAGFKGRGADPNLT